MVVIISLFALKIKIIDRFKEPVYRFLAAIKRRIALKYTIAFILVFLFQIFMPYKSTKTILLNISNVLSTVSKQKINTKFDGLFITLGLDNFVTACFQFIQINGLILFLTKIMPRLAA